MSVGFTTRASLSVPLGTSTEEIQERLRQLQEHPNSEDFHRNKDEKSEGSGDANCDDGFRNFVEMQLELLKHKLLAEHHRLTNAGTGQVSSVQASRELPERRRSWNGAESQKTPRRHLAKLPSLERSTRPRPKSATEPPAGFQSQGSVDSMHDPPPLPSLSPRGSIRGSISEDKPVFLRSPRGSMRGSIREGGDSGDILSLGWSPSTSLRSPRGSLRCHSPSIEDLSTVKPTRSPRRSISLCDDDSSNGKAVGSAKERSFSPDSEPSTSKSVPAGLLRSPLEEESGKDTRAEMEVETPGLIGVPLENGSTMSHEELRNQIHQAWHSESNMSAYASEDLRASNSIVPPMCCEAKYPEAKEHGFDKHSSLKSILSNNNANKRCSARTSRRASSCSAVGNSRLTFSNRNSIVGNGKGLDWAKDRSGSIISFEESTNFEPSTNRGRGTPRGSEIELFELLPVWRESAKKRKTNQRSLTHTQMSNKYTGLSLESPGGHGIQTEKTASGPWFILHPSSLKHILWDLVGLLLIAFDCVTVPLEVFTPPETLFTLTMSWFIRIFWTVNIPISCCTGYVCKNGNVEMNSRKVIVNYVRTWLAIDIFVVVFDWAEVAADSAATDGGSISTGEIGGAVRTMRMLRVVRLFRIIKAQEITDFITEHIRSERVMLIAVIAKIMAMMLGSAHVVACIWYGIGCHAGGDGPTWVKTLRIVQEPFELRYATSLHWSLLQFSGTLLFDPMNMAERAFAVTLTFTAFVIAACFVSSITTSMTRLQILSSQQSTQILTLRRYLADHNISRRLAVRVLRNAQHAQAEHRRTASEESVELLKIISEALRAELHFEIYSTMLWVHPFFSCYSEVNPMGVRKVCHSAVSILSVASGDVLFSDGEHPAFPRMFFLISGCITYEQQNREATQVRPGGWMCEATLWTTWRHCGTTTSMAESRMVVVDAVKFQNTCSNFATDHAMIYGIEFVALLNLNDRSNMTDLGEVDFELEEILVRAFPFLVADEDEEESMSGAEEDEDGLDFMERKGSIVSPENSTAFITAGDCERAADALQLPRPDRPSSEGKLDASKSGSIRFQSQMSTKSRDSKIFGAKGKGKKRNSGVIAVRVVKSVRRKCLRCCCRYRQGSNRLRTQASLQLHQRPGHDSPTNQPRQISPS